jgi:hypothetical protein
MPALIGQGAQRKKAMADQWWMMEIATEDVAGLTRQFAKAIRAQGLPKGAALFRSGGSGPRTTLFMAPGAVEIAKALLIAHDGKPCEKPTRGVFLDGHFDDPALLKSPYEV